MRDVTRPVFTSGLAPSRGMAVNRSMSIPSTGSGTRRSQPPESEWEKLSPRSGIEYVRVQSL
jgi:hypothetical protein